MSDSLTIEWEQSAECGDLFAAMAKAQGEIVTATKGKANPFFKSKYADLGAVWDVCREPLSKNGLCVIQQPFTRGTAVGLRTQLGHASGQWTACIATVVAKDQGPQAYGSVVTYLRRYALQAFAGVATGEDDDGESGEGRDRDAKPPGANWGKPKDRTKPAPANNDTGEVLDAGQLAELAEAFDTKWGRGAKSAAPSWLKSQFGTDNPANLTTVQAAEALQKLLAS